MTCLNVSFGIFAFLPPGWIFMALIILLECWLASRLLAHKSFKREVSVSVIRSNLISGLVGIGISMAVTGGWWLVVWFPWVTDHEVRSDALLGFTLYYLAAFVLSVLIEWVVNLFSLRAKYSRRAIFKATIFVNIASYVFGSLILFLISICG